MTKKHDDPGDNKLDNPARTKHAENAGEIAGAHAPDKGAVDAAHRANPRRSLGSLAAEQEHSIELFQKGSDGVEVKSSRHNPLTERQLADKPAAEKADTWQEALAADGEALGNFIKGLLNNKFELKGKFHEVPSTGSAVVEHFRTMLSDPRRNEGEFQCATGSKDGKHVTSPRYYEPRFYDHKGYEMHTAPMVSYMLLNGYKVESVMHSHPLRTDKASDEFSPPDKEQVKYLQEMRPDITVRSYLLTPDGTVKVYVPREEAKHPGGETVGHFDKDGKFILTNKGYESIFHGAH